MIDVSSHKPHGVPTGLTARFMSALWHLIVAGVLRDASKRCRRYRRPGHLQMPAPCFKPISNAIVQFNAFFKLGTPLFQGALTRQANRTRCVNGWVVMTIQSSAIRPSTTAHTLLWPASTPPSGRIAPVRGGATTAGSLVGTPASSINQLPGMGSPARAAATWIIVFHFLSSPAMNEPNASGVPGPTSTPSRCKRSLTGGVRNAATVLHSRSESLPWRAGWT